MANVCKLLFTRPQLFKRWIELLPDNSLCMHWITQLVLLVFIRWIVIYLDILNVRKHRTESCHTDSLFARVLSSTQSLLRDRNSEDSDHAGNRFHYFLCLNVYFFNVDCFVLRGQDVLKLNVNSFKSSALSFKLIREARPPTSQLRRRYCLFLSWLYL